MKDSSQTLSLSNSRSRNVSQISNKRGTSKPTHDVILGSIRKNESIITIITLNGKGYSGLITQFDKYTITLQVSNGDRVTIFKSSIESFSAPLPL